MEPLDIAPLREQYRPIAIGGSIMEWSKIKGWLLSHGLSLCCVLAPLALGVFSVDRAAALLLQGVAGVHLPYEFSVTADQSHNANGATVKQTDAVENRAIAFLAKDLHGRVSYSVASGFLFLASAAAMGFGVLFLARRDGEGPTHAFGWLLLFLVIGYAVAMNLQAFDDLRPLVVEKILAAAGNLAPAYGVLERGDADRTLANQILATLFPGVEGFGDPAVTRLLRLNTMVGFVGVGMLLASLFHISVRSEKTRTFEALRTRRTIMRLVLGLGAAVLVASVVASKILIEWPISLLTEAQQKSIAPIGGALNFMFGASGTMALIAAFGPAIVAYVLDLRDFREAHPVPARAEPAKAQEGSADDLAFAVLPSIAAIITAFTPLLTSPVLELVARIVKISHS
jgi:hypothetical protein